MQADSQNIDASVRHIEATGIGPLPDGAKKTFEEHLEFVVEFTQAQAQAIERGAPSIIVTALPKSGSASVTQTISRILNIPLGNLCWGGFGRRQRIIPMFAGLISRGGAVTHQHYSATPGNLKRLAAAGVRRLYAHVRDPRQALVSYIHHRRWYNAGSQEMPQTYFESRAYDQRLSSEEIDSAVKEVFPKMVQWIIDWVSAAEEGAFSIFVRVDSFERMVRERDEFYVDLFKHFGLSTTTHEILGLMEDREIRANIRRGATDEWQDVFPIDQSKIMSEMIPDCIKVRFGWPD